MLTSTDKQEIRQRVINYLINNYGKNKDEAEELIKYSFFIRVLELDLEYVIHYGTAYWAKEIIEDEENMNLTNREELIMDLSKIKLQIDGGLIEVFDIIVSNTTDHDITYGRPYVVREINNLTDMITIQNDKGELDIYTTEYFEKYSSEKHGEFFI